MRSWTYMPFFSMVQEFHFYPPSFRVVVLSSILFHYHVQTLGNNLRSCNHIDAEIPLVLSQGEVAVHSPVFQGLDNSFVGNQDRFDDKQVSAQFLFHRRNIDNHHTEKINVTMTT